MDFSALATIAERQDGLLTSEDFGRHGVPERTVSNWVAQGRLQRLHPRVWAVAGSPATSRRALRAAVLSAGERAVVSHRAAAHLWGLFDDEHVEISVPYANSVRLQAVTVHRSLDLDRARVVHRRGLPVTDPIRTVIDCGAVVGDAAASAVLEAALTARLFPVAAIEQMLGDLAVKGRRGCGVLRRVLDRRALASEVPESLLEVRMANLLAASSLPMPAFQHEVLLNGRRYRIDFAYPDLRIAIEVDGWAKFSSPQGARQVLARQNEMVNAGWLVLRFTWGDVVNRPGSVARAIADARSARLL